MALKKEYNPHIHGRKFQLPWWLPRKAWWPLTHLLLLEEQYELLKIEDQICGPRTLRSQGTRDIMSRPLDEIEAWLDTNPVLKF